MEAHGDSLRAMSKGCVPKGLINLSGRAAGQGVQAPMQGADDKSLNFYELQD